MLIIYEHDKYFQPEINLFSTNLRSIKSLESSFVYNNKHLKYIFLFINNFIIYAKCSNPIEMLTPYFGAKSI